MMVWPSATSRSDQLIMAPVLPNSHGRARLYVIGPGPRVSRLSSALPGHVGVRRACRPAALVLRDARCPLISARLFIELWTDV
jgi:hypothetical protein